MSLADLPEPVLVDPPHCACKGASPQMNEHTARHCSVLTTAELNALTRDWEAMRAQQDVVIPRSPFR